MAEYKVVMPKMGESIIEATILSWHKKEGDTIAENETSAPSFRKYNKPAPR